MDAVRLETDSLRLEFDRKTGSLVALHSKVSDWAILGRPRLGLSWRLMLPLEGRRNNIAWGHLQPHPPECTACDTCVEFRWPTVESEFGGVHRIAVTARCAVEKGRAVFRMHIRNDDAVPVENVYYPYLGDLHRPEGASRLTLRSGGYFAMRSREIWPTFPNDPGTHGVDFPTMTFSGPDNPPLYPFVLVSDDRDNGLYLGMAERRIEAATWHVEAHPGWRNSNDFRLFSEDFAEGHDVFTRFALGHLPFVAPGASFDLLPLALEGYRGDWSVGARCYSRISRSWNRQPTMPDWAKHPHSWLQVHINSPEDELRIPFRDLPAIGRECAQYGVQAIQLVGWNKGGQDRGNPCHDPDPRLGTWEELRDAIREIQAMGVKLILFAKFTWADESHPDFETVYRPLAIKDPFGNCFQHHGYQYQTLSQLSNASVRRLIPMCFGSDAYLDICRREFQKCIDLGADGILYDENQHHAHALCCFDGSHGHRWGQSVYAGDERLIDLFRGMVDETRFLIAGEASYDFQLDYYDVSYARTWGRDHVPYSRMIRPRANLMTAVIGFCDRSMINQCLLNRYIMSYEPFNFKGRLGDFPATVAYGQKMEALRRDLRRLFWDGDFAGAIGGSVRAEGGAPPHYAVYDGADGSQGMVICNHDEEQSVTVCPSLSSGQPLRLYRLVDDPESVAFEGSITLPPLSAAAVY